MFPFVVTELRRRSNQVVAGFTEASWLLKRLAAPLVPHLSVG